MVRGIHQPLNRWLLVFFFLLMAPGLLSVNLEFLRIVLVLPWSLLITVLGLNILLETFSIKYRWPLFAIILLLSAGMDFYHLAGPAKAAFAPENRYPPQSINLAEYRACPRLQNWAQTQGPGLVLTDLKADPMSRIFFVSCYPWDASANPAIDSKSALWAAFLGPTEDQPYLKRCFPQAETFPLSGENQPAAWTLYKVPLNNPGEELKFLDPYRLFQTQCSKILELSNGHSWQEPLQTLLDGYATLPQDPWWQTCYFERLLFTASWEKAFYPEDPLLSSSKLNQTLESSLQKAFPAARLAMKWKLWKDSE